MSRIYISAVAQHAGKTTSCLGLYRLFEELGKTINYIKPVGQRFQEYEGHRIDEDGVLFKEYLKCPTPVEALTAITIPKGFTEDYIFNRNKTRVYDDIDKAMMMLDESIDITIIEGTGHAGVGSVFDASNAAVACILGAKAIIIAGGGIGSCLDQIALNQALFQQENVEILGAIINKVLPEKYDKVNRAVRQGLKNMNIECLGVIPFDSDLTFPTVDQLIDDCKLECIYGNDKINLNHIQHNIVAAIPSEQLNSMLKKDTLLIVPGSGNKELTVSLNNIKSNNNISKVTGILFSDNTIPTDSLLEELKTLNIPLLSTEKDTFAISSKLGNLVVKISPKDPNKVETACELMKTHLDIDKIIEGMEDYKP